MAIEHLLPGGDTQCGAGSSSTKNRSMLVNPVPTGKMECEVSICHIQLRDLITCPNKRGEIYYVSRKRIMKGKFGKTPMTNQLKPFSEQLSFIPNVIVSTPTHIAAGGSGAELYLSSIPQERSRRRTSIRATKEEESESYCNSGIGDAGPSSSNIGTSDSNEAKRKRGSGVKKSRHQPRQTLVTKLDWPATINNSILLTRQLGSPITPDPSFSPSSPFESSYRSSVRNPLKVLISNNDKSVKIFGVEGEVFYRSPTSSAASSSSGDEIDEEDSCLTDDGYGSDVAAEALEVDEEERLQSLTGRTTPYYNTGPIHLHDRARSNNSLSFVPQRSLSRSNLLQVPAASSSSSSIALPATSSNNNSSNRPLRTYPSIIPPLSISRSSRWNPDRRDIVPDDGGDEGLVAAISAQNGWVPAEGLPRRGGIMRTRPVAGLSGLGNIAAETRTEKQKDELYMRDLVEISLNTPSNHTSLSPSNRTILTVGDTPDVFLFDIRSSGIQNPIGVYRGESTDAGFSTAWSRCGRKFGVASQDGIVTVWDVRSSKPLSTLYTLPSASSASNATPNFSPPSATHRLSPARVLKFTPPTSQLPTDLLIFTSDTPHLHIVDTINFERHEVVEIPLGSGMDLSSSPPTSPPGAAGGASAQGPWGGTGVGYSGLNGEIIEGRRMGKGTTGACFSPCGGWVYAATEGGIAEWRVNEAQRLEENLRWEVGGQAGLM